MSEVVYKAEREVDGEVLVMEVWQDLDVSLNDFELRGEIIGSHGRYSFGKSAENTELYTSWESWRKGELPKDAIVLPVYMYDHSGITLSTKPFSCPWDSGQYGFIYATRQKMREELGVKRLTKKHLERAYQLLEGDIQLVDTIVSGQVYGFSLSIDGEVVDSCGGFLLFDHDESEMFEAMEQHISADGFEGMTKELKQ